MSEAITGSVRDTIPRLHRIVDQPADQLVGLAAGADSFEACRVRYGETAERLQAEGRGRVTASRLPDSERNWAPTRDLLQELIRWGAIEPAPVPSARAHLDAHRQRRYELTDKGRRLAALAAQRGAPFTTAVADELIAAHPYFRALLEILESGPLVSPVPTETDVKRGRGGPSGWAAWAAELMGEGTRAEMLEQTVREHLVRRFGARGPDDRPTNKAIAEVLTDAFAVAGFTARGLQLDGPTIKTLRRWGTELLLFDQSRYVRDFPSASVTWSACHLQTDEDGTRHGRRRGRAEYGEQVAVALINAYREQEGMGSGIAVPIHRIRAQAAYDVGVMRVLVDRVLSDLIDGDYPQFEVQAFAFIGNCELPDSEPPFRHRGRIRLEVQIAPAGAGLTNDRS